MGALVGSALAWNLAVGQEAFSTNCRSLLVQLWDTDTSSLWGMVPAGQAFGALRNRRGLKNSTSLLGVRRNFRGDPVNLPGARGR